MQLLAQRASSERIGRGWGSATRGLGVFVPRDDEIKKLCTKVLRQAEDLEAFQATLGELRAAIREHFAKMENDGIRLVPKKRKVRDRLKNGTTG